MKKIFICCLVFVLAVFSASARTRFSLGIKSVFGFPLGTALAYRTPNTQTALTASAGGGVYARYNFPLNLPAKSWLGMQVDVVITARNGIGEKKEGTSKLFYMFDTLDIPLLLVYQLPIGKTNLRLAVGPNISFLCSKVNVSLETKNSDEHRLLETQSPFLLGIVGDFGFSISVNSISLLLNLRYLNDFSVLRAGNADILTRRNLILSLGIEMDI